MRAFTRSRKAPDGERILALRPDPSVTILRKNAGGKASRIRSVFMLLNFFGFLISKLRVRVAVRAAGAVPALTGIRFLWVNGTGWPGIVGEGKRETQCGRRAEGVDGRDQDGA